MAFFIFVILVLGISFCWEGIHANGGDSIGRDG
jgi:hypothetical protein